MYRLRELEYKDLKIINQWRNNPELISMLGATFRYINYKVDEKWFEDYMNNRNKQVRCAITEECNDDIIALVSLTSVDYINQSAEFHIMVGDSKKQGKGVGTFAIRAMLKHAFLDMNLQRIELRVLTDNVRAQHLYEKSGFVKEGTLRKCVYKNGCFVDMYVYAILKSEYGK